MLGSETPPCRTIIFGGGQFFGGAGGAAGAAAASAFVGSCNGVGFDGLGAGVEDAGVASQLDVTAAFLGCDFFPVVAGCGFPVEGFAAVAGLEGSVGVGEVV